MMLIRQFTNCFLLSFLLLILFIFMPFSAMAVPVCTGTSQTLTVPMPAKISIPSDAPIGTQLSEWVIMEPMTNWYTCDGSYTTSTGTTAASYLNKSSGLSLSADGRTYTVYETNLPGVGMAIGFRPYIGDCGWSTVWLALISGSFRGIGCNSTKAPFGGQLKAILIKTGPMKSGTINSVVIAQSRLRVEGAYNPETITFRSSATEVTVLSCMTPDVQVMLGSHKITEFKGIGTTTPSTSFNISLNNCPAGLNTITYQIDATTPILNTLDTVVALNAASTAAGVGVQLLDDKGNPFPLNTPIDLTAYNTSTGGNYAIPLSARYYQTEIRVKPGIANTAMIFTVIYK